MSSEPQKEHETASSSERLRISDIFPQLLQRYSNRAMCFFLSNEFENLLRLQNKTNGKEQNVMSVKKFCPD